MSNPTDEGATETYRIVPWAGSKLVQVVPDTWAFVPADPAENTANTAGGLEHRFNVSRVDGRDAPGGDREGTRYFVLDPAHDATAFQALVFYAENTPNEKLAADLRDWLGQFDVEP